MQDKNNIQNKDIFSESLKNKLENHFIPLDESVWIEIEKRLETKKNRIVPFWFWLSGGVAASLALLFFLNPLRNTNVPSLAVTKTIQTQVAVVESQINSLSENGNTEKKRTVTNIVSVSTLKIINKNTLSAPQEKNLSNQIADIVLKTPSEQQNMAFQAKEVNEGLVNNDLQVKDSIPAKKTEPKLTSLPEIPDILEEPKEKSKKKLKNNWLLAANFETNGSADIHFANGDLYAGTPQLTADEAYGNELNNVVKSSDVYILQPGDFTSVEYLAPVSVGFSIQKALSQNLSISSGLVYTYLRSNYSLNNQWERANASLNLHYLGIPINLNVMITEKKHWHYYFSVGGMIEKGLKSIYKQTITYNNSTHQTEIYSKINGVQTSANAAFGIGYQLDKKWSLFFEPKIIYYFDNNQPMSARTQTPFNVGFSSGLKLGL